jgi:hypothetical protein
MKIWIGILVMCFGNMGCLEIRGPEQQQAPGVQAEVQSVSFNRLLVDRPLYFWDGQFVEEEEWNQIQSQNSTASSSDHEIFLDELVFENAGVLYTNGFNLRLHVSHLKSDFGSVVTFPKGQKAPVAQVGRSGGSIVLDIEQAMGSLNVEMRGEDGGDGKPGPDPDASMAGKDAYLRRNDNGSKWNFGYLVPATEGLRGFAGFNGRDGGSTGTLELHIRSYQEFKFFPVREPGAGGQGGPGGPGGQGGLNKKPNQRAPTGPPGPQGEVGLEGEVQSICTFYDQNISCL